MPDGIPTNGQRAEWAYEALSTFADNTRADPNEAIDNDLADLIADLICDLGHYAKQNGLDYTTVVARGVGMWSAEDRHSEGNPYENDIAVIMIQKCNNTGE